MDPDQAGRECSGASLPAHRGQLRAGCNRCSANSSLHHVNAFCGNVLVLETMSDQWVSNEGPECSPTAMLDPHSGALRTDTARVLDLSTFDDRPRLSERAPVAVAQVGNPGGAHQQTQTALPMPGLVLVVPLPVSHLIVGCQDCLCLQAIV